MVIDPNQMRSIEAQVHLQQQAQQLQQQNLVTQQSALAHDACKFIVEHPDQFGVNVVEAALKTIGTVATIFAPQTSPPPPEEKKAV